jgi:hypothetical protein
MPINACVFFHACAECGVGLRPVEGDCCVFCSYGSAPCPPMQEPSNGADCCRPLTPGDDFRSAEPTVP